MLKVYTYLNSLFIFGLVIYLFSQKIGIEFSNLFYFVSCLFSLVIPMLFIVSNFNYEDREEKTAYLILFLGFLIYGFGNLIWYFNDAYFEILDVKYVNLIFIFQCFSKHYFFRYLSLNLNGTKNHNYFTQLFSLNIGILLLALFFSENLQLESYLVDIYFVLESLLTVIFIVFCMKESFGEHIDLKYFMIGNLIWFIADILFLLETYSNTYFSGNLADFIYFVGLYFMLYSILIKNFNFTEKLNYIFDLQLKLS
jgi:hypothetical protein